MYLYIKGVVGLPDEKCDLHLTKVEVTDFNSFTDEKAEETLSRLKELFTKQSKGISCEAEYISKEEYAGLCGPLWDLIP